MPVDPKAASGIWESIGVPSQPVVPVVKEPVPVIIVGLSDLLANERVQEIIRLIKPKVVTGPFSTVFRNQTTAFTDTDKDLDVTDYNCVHVDVAVGGSTPSAALTLYSIPAAGYQGPAIALPGPNASQTITASKSFDCASGSTFLRVGLGAVTGGNFTVTLTPFNAAFSTDSLAAGLAIIGKVGIDQTTDGTTNKVAATQATHDNLNLNANLQVGNTDVGGANKVPVDDADTQTLLAGGLPAALGAGGGLKIDGSGTALPVSGTVTATVANATLAAGSATIGATQDAGPSWTSTRQVTTSADMTGAADLTAAPTAGQKIVVDDVIVSADTAMYVDFLEETSATLVFRVYLPAGGTAQVTTRSKLKLDTADKKVRGDASVAGNVAVTVLYHSEA